MKLFFNRVPRYEPYGGGSHFVTEMVEYLKKKGEEVVFHLEEGIDLIFLIDPRPGDIGYSIQHIHQYKLNNPNVRILHRINENDARKNTNFMDDLLIKSSSIADSVIFISEYLKEYFENKGFNRDSLVIYNGCNLNSFYPEKEKTIKGKIKLVTHHWSDNWLKGFDIYTKIDDYLLNNDDNFEFTYIGRYNKTYNPKATNLVKPLYGLELGSALRKHDIYVTATRFEPCGMHHVEATASGLPVLYHKDSGGPVELQKHHGEEFSNFDQFLRKLNLISKNIELYRSKIDYEKVNIVNCCDTFYQEIQKIVQ